MNMKKTQKIMLAVNLVLMIAVFVGNYFYLTVGGLTLKALCSSGFALMGLANLAYALLNKTNNRRFVISMAIGLVFACLGDIFLGFDFILGASLFAIGHICYFVAYGMLEKLGRLDLVIGGVIFLGAGSFVLFGPLTYSESFMKWVCLVYALVISSMVGKAIGNFIRKRSLLTSVILVGSVLFFFSDLMLVFDRFMGMGRISGLLCMATYYPAECLLALSVLLSTNVFNKKESQKS